MTCNKWINACNAIMIFWVHGWSFQSSSLIKSWVQNRVSTSKNFARIQSPILVHLEWSCWVNCDLVRSCRVNNSRFVTVLTYGLTGHTLAKYPTKRLPRARSIKGMGASWHRKMSRPNELVGIINVRKSKRKE